MTQNARVRAIAVSLVALISTTLLPVAANAQSWGQRRQNTKNEWRNLAIAAGGLTAYGLIKHDPTISFLGGAGALYSLDRYEQDRKSQDAASRARAAFFSRPNFYRDGHRYDRVSSWNHGHQYYHFVRRG